MNERQYSDFIRSLQDLQQRKLVNMAEERCLEHLESYPEDNHVKSILAGVYWDLHDFSLSLDLYLQMLRDEPELLDVYRLAAQAALRSGNRDLALKIAGDYREKAGETAELTLLLIDIYERNNMIDEAYAELQRERTDATSLDRPGIEYFTCRILVQQKKYDEAIDLIMSILNQTSYSSSDKIRGELYFLLAKVYDRTGEYDKAWAAAESAHQLEGGGWDMSAYERRAQSIMDFMDRDTIEGLACSSLSDEKPIFIVGNPRSGTSLLEQILGMHPAIDNGGEMSISTLIQSRSGQIMDSFHEWPTSLYDMRVADADAFATMYAEARARLAPETTMVSNKSLVLQEQLGFLSRILPAAKAINLRRHPLDNCVSCFTTSISNAGHHYAGDLQTLARTWIVRRKLQDHWPTVLDTPILELHYEDLVANQEHETRRLLDFLEVPWEEGCMDFHRSTRVARTISYDQVNKKMYNTSAGRWKRYEKHLGPLIDMLGDYL